MGGVPWAVALGCEPGVRARRGVTGSTMWEPCSSTLRHLGTASLVIALVAMLQQQRSRVEGGAPQRVPSGGDPYAILGVSRGVEKETIVKAYRALAKRWHPDRNGGDKAAEAVFATVAHAYDVLTDPEKREVFDRLGERGLERMRDGDPSVHKDWLTPDEVLRRIHHDGDGDEALLASIVTSSFASFAALLTAWQEHAQKLFLWIGMRSENPSVYISATDAAGTTLASGGSTASGVTFKFALSGKSFDFVASDVTHNCGAGSFRFLGMKTTFYLQCEHVPGSTLSVSVPAGAFTVTDKKGASTPSEVFVLTMR